MDEEVPPALELDNQILAAASEAAHPFALELAGDDFGGLGPREPRIGDLDVLERPADETGLEPSANRLDLR
jgi:hypothetical protein